MAASPRLLLWALSVLTLLCLVGLVTVGTCHPASFEIADEESEAPAPVDEVVDETAGGEEWATH